MQEYKDLNRDYQFQSDELMAQLNSSELAKKEMKISLEVVNEKVIIIEEELYESKTVQNELLEELKANEERLQEAVSKLDSMQD